MFRSPPDVPLIINPRRLAGMALALMLSATPVHAQSTGAVTGTVVDAETRQPLGGAQISIADNTRGGLTDARGRFLIPGLPTGSYTIRVTNIGYRTEEKTVQVSADQPVQLDFALEVSAVALDQLVVTGTGGAVARSKLGSSMGSLDVSREQELTPVSTVGQALEARIPGVQSTATGGVGTARDIRIRGTSSFNLGARPVIYIDGVRVDNSAGEWAGNEVNGGTCCAFSGGAGEDRLADLDPNDIDRIEVLKGAAAATLYGTEATNGVIQIFTKSGRNNSRPSFTFAMSAGFNRYRENWATKLYPNFQGPAGFQAHDANELIQNGVINNYNLTAQGGGTDVTYFVSAGFDSEEGSLQPNNAKKANLRVHLKWLPSDKWSFDINSAFARNNVLDLQSGNNWTALYGNAILGNPLHATADRPYGEPWTSVADIRAIDAHSKATRWTGGFTASYQASHGFTQKLTLGFDNVNDQKTRLLPFGSNYIYLGTGGERNIGYRSATTATIDYLGTVALDLGGVGSDFSFGAQGYWNNADFSMAIGRGFAGQGVTTVGGAANTLADEFSNETITLGMFVQDRFSFGDRLFTTVGLRVDGNSAFGVNYGLQPYPKADMAYLLSNESFLPDFISNLKLRAAIGTSGLAPGAYDQFTTYNPTAVLETNVPGVTPANPGNPELQPEKTTEVELGFDLGLWDDRLGVEFTAYRSRTRDGLLQVSLPPSEGFEDAQLRNAGKIQNTGWEVSFNTTPVVTPSFRWTTQLNLDGNHNEVLDLGSTAVDGRLGNYRVGYPVNSVWGYDITGYDPATNKHTKSDTTNYHGSAVPRFNASLGNTLTLGAFRLYGLVSLERGAWFNNGDRPYRIRQGAGDEYLATFENGQPTLRTDSLVDYFTLVSSDDKRDNVRIRELSLAYTLPDGLASSVGLAHTTVTLAGQNLWWWDGCNCADPDMRYEPGAANNFSGFLAMPAARRFLFSIRTNF